MVRPVPRRKEILRDDSGESGCTLSKSVVGEGVTARTPWIEIVAIIENFLVEEFRKVVDKNPTGTALIVVVDSGRRIQDSAVVNCGGLGESEASGEVMVVKGDWGW